MGCFICCRQVPDDLDLDPDITQPILSQVQVICKLLEISISISSTNENPSSTHFCTKCSGQIDQVEDLYKDLEEIQSRLESIKKEFEKELLTGSHKLSGLERNQFNLRSKIVKELEQNIQVKIEAEDQDYFESPPSPIDDIFESVPESTLKIKSKLNFSRQNSPYLKNKNEKRLQETCENVDQDPKVNLSNFLQDQDLQQSTSFEGFEFEETAGFSRNKPTPTPTLPTTGQLVLLNEDNTTCDESNSNDQNQDVKPNLQPIIAQDKFTCGKCELVFPSEFGLKNHLITSGHKGYKCDVCSKLYETELQLIRHKEIGHPVDTTNTQYSKQSQRQKNIKPAIAQEKKERIRIRKSRISIVKKEEKKRKSRRKIENEIYSCGECGLDGFPEKEDLLEHLMLTGHKRYRCSSCPYLNQVKANVKKHEITHSSEYNFECPNCPLKFKLARYRDYHVKKNVCKNLQCPIENCDLTFRNKVKLQAHLKIHNPNQEATLIVVEEKRYTCEYCTMSYTAPRNLRAHIVTKHKGEYKWKYQCSIDDCDKGFDVKHTYDLHLRIHQEQPEILAPEPSKKICDICGVTVASSHLQKHIQSVHGEKKKPPCRCTFPGCDKLYTNQFGMKRCMMRHTMTAEELKAIRFRKQLPCEKCGKLFTQRNKLNEHILSVHDKLKPHKCHQCDKQFSVRGTLRSHILAVHKKSKPHKCTVGDCSWTFALKPALLEHYSIHINPSRAEFNEEFYQNQPEGLQEFLQKRKIAKERYMKKIKDKSTQE